MNHEDQPAASERRFIIISTCVRWNDGPEELISKDVFTSTAATPAAALWERCGWLDGMDGAPVGEIVQHPEGHWHFPGDDCLRLYVQVD